MTFSNGYNKLTVGYFELKLHKYILGTPETNITCCKKGHNRWPLRLNTNLSRRKQDFIVSFEIFLLH